MNDHLNLLWVCYRCIHRCNTTVVLYIHTDINIYIYCRDKTRHPPPCVYSFPGQRRSSRNWEFYCKSLKMPLTSSSPIPRRRRRSQRSRRSESPSCFNVGLVTQRGLGLQTSPRMWRWNFCINMDRAHTSV